MLHLLTWLHWWDGEGVVVPVVTVSPVKPTVVIRQGPKAKVTLRSGSST